MRECCGPERGWPVTQRPWKRCVANVGFGRPGTFNENILTAVRFAQAVQKRPLAVVDHRQLSGSPIESLNFRLTSNSHGTGAQNEYANTAGTGIGASGVMARPSICIQRMRASSM